MREVHLIGNAHLDPVWLWNWQEGYTEVLSTFRSALDRMKENGSYVFTCTGALYYRWVEETAPEMFQEISRRIKEGRWVIAGGWWIQPDGRGFMRSVTFMKSSGSWQRQDIMWILLATMP